MYRIGIDLGGTNIAVGIVDENRRMIKTDSIPTDLPVGPGNLAKNISDFVYGILEENGILPREILSAGIGIPGTVDPHTGMVEYANNLGFIHVPFAGLLGAFFPFPLHSGNDAKAAALGEYLAGAGAGSSSMVMVTLGTGIGGAMIIDGKLIDGFHFAAGEIGHMVIEHNGRSCNCGRKGCFETYASASALAMDARHAAAACQDSILYLRCGGNVEAIDGKAVFQAAEEGDITARQVLHRYISYLSEGVINLINIFQPEILCIGGGLSGAGDKLLLPLREKASELSYCRDSHKNTRIVCASLGNLAGILGAAYL